MKWQDLLAAEFGHPYMTPREQEEFAALIAPIEAALKRPAPAPSRPAEACRQHPVATHPSFATDG